MKNESINLNKDERIGSRIQKYLTPAFLLGLIVLLGTALRFYDLGSESYWIDEMSTVIEGQQSIHQMITSGRLDQPPAYYLPFHFWVRFLGTSEVSTRSFSVLTGIGSIILIYLVGREMFGNKIGLLSSLLMTITEFQIYYSQEARFYAFFEFTTLLSFLFFIMVLSKKKNIYYFLYSVTSIIMIYGHPYGVLIIVSQNLFFFIKAIKNKGTIFLWLIFQALIVLAILPYLFPLLLNAGGLEGAVNLNIEGYSLPSIVSPFRSIYHFIFSPRYDRNWFSIIINYSFAGVFLVIGTWVNFIKKRDNREYDSTKEGVYESQVLTVLHNKIILLSCWLLVPIVVPFLASYVIGPMYHDHYTISAAPALYLLLAFGIYRIRKIVPLIVALCVLAIMIIPGLSYYYRTNTKEEWREAATYVNEDYRTGDVIVFAPEGTKEIFTRSFKYYFRSPLRSCGLDNNLMEQIMISNELMRCAAEYDRLWVIIPDDTPKSSSLFTNFFLNPNRIELHLLIEHKYVGLSVYLFKLTK
jgi:mannosyltransferase